MLEVEIQKQNGPFPGAVKTPSIVVACSLNLWYTVSRLRLDRVTVVLALKIILEQKEE